MKMLVPNTRKAKAIFAGLSIVTIAIISVVSFWQIVVLSYLNSPMQLGVKPFYYHFKAGSSFSTIVRDLAKQGLLEKPRYLLLYAKINNKTRNLHSGIYKIEPRKTPLDLLQTLERGLIAAFNLRTNEGNTFKQMMISISVDENLTHTLNSLDPEYVMSQIGYPNKQYEGYFYPDTYNQPLKISDVEFLNKSYLTMQNILQYEWANRDPKIILKNKHELLTLASIIEKETSKYNERFKMSAVFHNRLKINMRLQTDPTVIYGIGDKFKGNLTKQHLLTFTPFNTYRINGLPPTPICMPSRVSIEAAAHPSEDDLLYFVAKGDGSHQFSKSYYKHLKAVKKYQINPAKKRNVLDKAKEKHK